MKLITRILASPLVALYYAITFLKPCGFSRALQQCIEVVDAAPTLPDRFVTTLVAAEDHRSAIHPGVDPIAICRVILVWTKTGAVQGASTIEQQLVRVVLGRYEKTLRRKFWEQLLAIGLSSRRPKSRIAMAYLSIAFYGSGQYGLSALMRRCGSDLHAATQGSVSEMVARLKYPEPLIPPPEWRQTILRRVCYIAHRLQGSANSRLQATRMMPRAPEPGR